MRRVQGLMATVAVAGLLLVGCGDDNGSPAITGTPPPTSEPASTTSTTQLDAPADATVRIVSSTLGDVIADSNGRTLYTFANDEPGTSNCTGECVQTWPRYAPAELVGGIGIDDERLDSISVDGVQQATLDDKPLYYYAADTEPGDVKGQGVAGAWFALRATGDPVH